MLHNFYDPNTKFNKIYMFIGNTVTVITGAIAFITFIIGQISKSSENIPKYIDTIVNSLFDFCLVTFVLAVLISVGRIIYVALKTKSQSLYIQRKLSEFVHTELIHNIRNDIVELETLSDKLQKYLKDGENAAMSECYENEWKELKKNLKNYVNSLAKYLSEYRETTISVCIKIFKKRDKNRNEFQTEEIISLVRSSNTEDIRNNNERTFVGQNTDFTNLCEGRIVFFGSSNLQRIKESGHYINDSKNWEENKYTSTLVTPIRYFAGEQNNNMNKKIRPDVIGFLCIDSEEEIKEWENADSFELQIMAIFSDILYVYIKEFYKCFENIGYKMI